MFKRRYKLNEKIFEDVKTEEQAYWLGFFAADGTITENKIRLRLNCKDYSHLQKWKKFTGWTGKDYFCQRTDACEVYFRSSKIKADLAKYTITNRKTFTLEFPAEQLSESLLRHYVRGYFDGDGCIAKQTRKTVKPSGKVYTYESGEFSIEGNREFILSMREEIFYYTLYLPFTSIRYSGKRIYRIRYGGIDQLATIYKYLYENSSMLLERKENVFRNILLRRERLSERTPGKAKQQSELHSNMQSVGRNSTPPL